MKFDERFYRLRRNGGGAEPSYWEPRLRRR